MKEGFEGLKDGFESIKEKGVLESIKDAFMGGMDGDDEDGAIPCPEACPEINPPEAPTGGASKAWDSFTEGIKKLGDAVKDTWKEMLAFGAAILMIGGGIAIAALGLSKLVESFQNLSGGQIAGALAALVIVGILFAGMLHILAGASLTAVGPMLALGLAFLLIGGGIALAAIGMSVLVGSFAQLKGGQLIAASFALGIFSIAVWGLVAAAAGATAASPALLAMAGLLAAIGVAALLMGIGINIAAKGLTLMVEALVQIPPAQIVAIAGAIYTLGMSLITLGAGSVVAAVGLGVLAAALLLTAYPLTIGSGALYIFGGALMLVGTGMNLVAVGATSLKSSILAFVTVLPELREFTSALKDIGGASWGIIKTAAAMTALTASLGPFALGLALLQLKKLEALAEFNKSATLTVKNVQKPAIPNEALAATQAAMDSSSTTSSPKASVSKPVINFSQKSIVVKIGERELQDVFIEFLKHPEVANAISGMGN